MASGPRAGLGEIALPDLQPGSSIMPGKVNPVICEATLMVCAQVIGNDAAVTFAGASGNFELNVMLPVMARNTLESIQLLANVSRLLADRCVQGIEANVGGVTAALEDQSDYMTDRMPLFIAGVVGLSFLLLLVAFHSPLMAPAVEVFQPHLAAAPLRDPAIPVVANATAEPVTEAEELRELLARQLTGRVRWTESVRRMAALGVDTFIEVGPGTVLGGLIKRTVDGTRVLSAANAEGVAGVADALRMQADGDVAKGEGQGEVVVLPERFAVSPGHGRFYPVTPSRFNDERPYVEPGDLLGEVRNGAASIPVRSPFRGWVMAHLAWEGELVTPGQILLSLRPF
jgi:pyruvate/2-oxoglutarate dehydrogenase complex dihydrolipoamide acyltransferase (E2) component